MGGWVLRQGVVWEWRGGTRLGRHLGGGIFRAWRWTGWWAEEREEESEMALGHGAWPVGGVTGGVHASTDRTGLLQARAVFHHMHHLIVSN